MTATSEGRLVAPLDSDELFEAVTGEKRDAFDYTGRHQIQNARSMFSKLDSIAESHNSFFTTNLAGHAKNLVIEEEDRKKRVQKSIKMYYGDQYYGNMVDNITALIVGRGITIRPDGKRNQNRWEAFEKANKFQTQIQEVVRSVLVTGEAFIRFFTDNKGHVYTRLIDPTRVTDVVTQKGDVQTLRGIKFSTATQRNKFVSAKELIYIKYDPFGVSPRGIPYINEGAIKKLERVDLLEYTRLLLNVVRASIPLVWKVPGGAKQVRAAGESQTKLPGAGSMMTIGINEEMFFPDLNINSSDTKEDSKTLLNGVAAAGNVTIDFISGAGVDDGDKRLLDAGSPVVRSMEVLQAFFIEGIEQVVDVVIGDGERRVVPPRIAQRNLQSDAQGLIEIFKAGSISRGRISEYLGYDYHDILEELEQELKDIKDKNLVLMPFGLQIEDQARLVQEIIGGGSLEKALGNGSIPGQQKAKRAIDQQGPQSD